MAKSTVLLYPGAGTGCDHSSLIAIEQRLSPAAFVERRDFINPKVSFRLGYDSQLLSFDWRGE